MSAKPTTGTPKIQDPVTSRLNPISVDLSFLQDRRIYHQLRHDDIAKAFLESQRQPAVETCLEELLGDGHFRRAAETAVHELLHATVDSVKHILQLLYTRLACLVIIGQSEIAADEAAPLTDFLARNAPGARELLPLLPWELRLLLVRLQSMAADDGGRRGIMALFALAGEVRAHVREARTKGDEVDLLLWSDRLREHGLRIADTLVEMGELETADRHLDTLVDAKSDEIWYRKALLRTRVGDVADAQRCTEKMKSVELRSVLQVSLIISTRLLFGSLVALVFPPSFFSLHVQATDG